MTDDIGAFPVCDHDTDDYGPWVSAARAEAAETALREVEEALLIAHRAGLFYKRSVELAALKRTLSKAELEADPGPEEPRTCQQCYGGGEVHWNPSPFNDPQCDESATCPRCDGEGVEPGAGTST
jgi:hypothetical protein